MDPDTCTSIASLRHKENYKSSRVEAAMCKAVVHRKRSSICRAQGDRAGVRTTRRELALMRKFVITTRFPAFSEDVVGSQRVI